MILAKEWCRSITRGLFMTMNGLLILLSKNGILFPTPASSYFILAFAAVDIKLLSNYGDQQPEGTLAGDLTVIISCIVLISICICGILAVLKANLKAIFMYIASIILMMILQILVGIYMGVQRYGLQYRVAEWLRDDFFSNATDVEHHIHTWDDLQTKYECCGLNGPEDYLAINQAISMSCCQRAYRARTVYAQRLLYGICIESTSYYQNGCEDEILDLLREDSEWLLGASVFVLWAEGLGVMLAVWVTNNMRNSVHVYKKTVKY
ncbi:hypothetical protein ACJJTC_008387 [Scirpophaga incertulas]